MTKSASDCFKNEVIKGKGNMMVDVLSRNAWATEIREGEIEIK